MVDENKSMILNINDVLNDALSSIKISNTTKGITWEIKVYNREPEEALNKANILFDKCKTKYGGPSR